MSDFESDLREMFRRREADLPWPVQPPARIGRKVRRRQARTGALAAVVAAMLIGAALLGYGALTDSTGTYVPADETAVSTTAYAGGVGITYTSSWQLTGYMDLETARQLVVLTNFEADPTNDDVCAVMPAYGVALLVQPDQVVPGGIDPQPWPVELRPAAAPEHCTGDGSGSVWSTAVQRTFGAQAFVGPTAT